MSTYERIRIAKARRDPERLLNDVAWISSDEGQRWLEARNRELREGEAVVAMIRGIDRAHDIDLGPSGYAPRGHHFEAIGHMPTPTEIRMAAERKERGVKKRVIPARCLFEMFGHRLPASVRWGIAGATDRSNTRDADRRAAHPGPPDVVVLQGLHMPAPAVGDDGIVRCSDCLQKLRTYPLRDDRRWRHYSSRTASPGDV